MTDGPRVEAIDRALSLLTSLADAGPEGLPLTELAAATGVNKSTAYRALSTMRAHGFVHQGEVSGDYRLGAAALALGERFETPEGLAQSLHPAVVALSRAADELVHLGILQGDQVRYLDKVEPERAIRVWSQVGRRTPAATCALGRALLAARDVTNDGLAAYLPAGDPALPALIEAVQDARRRGYSTEVEESEPGIACLGVAVLNGTRAVLALSVTMPVERLTATRQRELSTIIRTVVPPLLPDGMSLPAPQEA